LTQDDLVRKSGVKRTTLTKIESNVVVKPSVQTVAKIAKALGIQMRPSKNPVFDLKYGLFARAEVAF